MADSKAGTRYTTLTADNQSANLWVVTILTICITTAGLFARGFAKGSIGTALKKDDWTIIGAWASLSKFRLTFTIF